MKLSRRKVLARSALSGVAVGASGCLSRSGGPANLGGPGPDVTVKFEGSVSTDEPLVENVAVSTRDPFPYQYSYVAFSEDTKGKIRKDYVREEMPLLVDELEETDFESQSLVFFGMVLPETKQLQAGPLSLEDGTLHSEYRIGSDSSGASGLTINTYIRRLEPTVRPENVKFEVTFQSAPSVQ